jgi:hypothetical protein
MINAHPKQITAKIDIVDLGFTTHCWSWTGALNEYGYGRTGGTIDTYAHRLSYKIFIGAIGKDLHIDHLCRNRRCVNPLHLEAVTRSENLKRRVNHYANRTHCKNGHDLTEENTHVTKTGKSCKKCRYQGLVRWRNNHSDIARQRNTEAKRKWRKSRRELKECRATNQTDAVVTENLKGN